MESEIYLAFILYFKHILMLSLHVMVLVNKQMQLPYNGNLSNGENTPVP